MRFHDIRGCYIDLNHSNGIAPVYSSRQVGHARVSTTTDIYTFLNNDIRCKAKENIENDFFKKALKNDLKK